MIDVRVENPGDEYEWPLTKTVVAASLPSRDRRVRLGAPARSKLAVVRSCVSNRCAW
jgi:hypothetical protein